MCVKLLASLDFFLFREICENLFDELIALIERDESEENALRAKRIAEVSAFGSKVKVRKSFEPVSTRNRRWCLSVRKRRQNVRSMNAPRQDALVRQQTSSFGR